VRDLILGQAITTDSGMLRDRFGAFTFAPIADFGLLRAAADRAAELGIPAHVGNLASSDIFYDEAGLEGYEPLIRHGVLGIEMEAAALYTLAARFGARALCIVTMTDCLITAAELTAEERQSSLRTMVELALDIAVSEG
jgi:purine-nucleoside phosphorylase